MEEIMMTARDILRGKGNQVFSATPGSTVYDALTLMAEKNVGALMVVDEEKLVGVFSERDYARKVVLKGKFSRETTVGEVMSSNPLSITPDEEITACMKLMTERQIRHLPVVEKNVLTGIVSIGDVVKAVIEDQKDSIQNLERYIIGR
jgi:CBS domain-containing protein